MAVELGHTSAPSGVEPGSSGFTTVVRTSGMPGETGRTLEQLSGYVLDGDPPMPVFGHRIIRVAARPTHVLSTIRPCGVDHSGRENRMAWHLALDSTETTSIRFEDARAWLVDRASNWNGVPRIEPDGPSLSARQSAEATEDADAWTTWECDPRWADVLAQAACGEEMIAVIVPPEADLERLVTDIHRAVPSDQRWQATVCSGTTGSERNLRLQVAVVQAGSDAARKLKGGVARRVIELPNTPLPEPVAARPQHPAAATSTTSAPRPARQSHAYLFEEPAAEEGAPESSEPTAAPRPTRPRAALEPRTDITKPMIILISIGIIALLGLIALILV